MLQRTATIAFVMVMLTLVPLVSVQAGSPPPLELYGTLPKTEKLVISPNGEMFAAVFTVGDIRLFSVFKPDGTVLIKENVGSNKITDLDWAGDDYVIVFNEFRTQIMDEEVIQPLVIKVSTGSIEPLVAENRRFRDWVRVVYGYFQEDGAWYAYVSLMSAEREVTLCKVNLDTRIPKPIEVLEGYQLVFDDKGKIVARAEYYGGKREWNVYGADMENPLASGKADFGFGIKGLGRTPGTILVNLDGTEDRLVEIRLDGSGQEDLLPGGTDLIYSPYTRLLLGAFRPGEKRRMVMYEPTLDRRMASIERAFKGAEVTVTSVSADHSKVVALIEDDDLPGTWQLIDFKTGQANPIAEIYPGIPSDMVGPTRMYSYKAADGLALEGVLTLPPGSNGKNLPVVVIPHGGPEAHDRLGFDSWAQVFATRGYAVFQPNYRGSDGYGTEFRNAGFGEWGRKMQTDISDGVAALAADGIVDLKRACIVGGSFGGYAALAGVTVQQGLYRCAASYSGVSDSTDMLGQKAPRRGSRAVRRYWTSYLGDAPPKVVKEISPRANAARADAPILLVYGEDDWVVDPRQSLDMETALRRAKKPVELIKLENEDHFLSRSATRLQWFKAMVEFVQKHNPA
jgi:dienelactone hydrolase